MNLAKKANSSQVARFGIVGIANTVLDFGLLFGLKALGLPSLGANIISTGTAFVFSFFANKKYTFKSTSKDIAREIALFVIVTLTGLWVLQSAIIATLEPRLAQFIHSPELVLLIAKLFATLASLTWNYLLYKKIVFKTP